MAVGAPVQFVVITPERRVVEDSADSVVFTAHDGEVGILRDRAPLMCELGIGQIRYETGAKTQRVFIDGGFAQVLRNSVTVLTPHAIPADEITADTIADAERAVSELTGTDPETLSTRLQAQRRLQVLRSLQSGA